jgi:hypothetical protein
MNSSSRERTSSIITQTVRTLEAYGHPPDTYTLHDHIDMEALEDVVASSSGYVSVEFSVDGTRLEVTSEGVVRRKTSR